MKRFEIWNRERDYDSELNIGRIWKSEDIEQVIAAYEMRVYKVENVDVTQENINKLNDMFKEINFFDDTDESLEIIKGEFPDADLTEMGDVLRIHEAIVIDNNSDMFGDLNDWESEKSVEYWDGHNWKRDWVQDDCTEIEVSDNCVCLDEWDGRNWKSRGDFEHEYVYKVYTVNGESVEDEYMIIFSSQYQEIMDTACIVEEQELKERLELLERDIEDYMNRIKEVA
jgi:hypothetical protein